MRATLIQDLIAEGDRVVGRFNVHGTHTGPFPNLAPTGRTVRVDIIDIIDIIDINRIAGSRIVERWRRRTQSRFSSNLVRRGRQSYPGPLSTAANSLNVGEG
jgi:predicted ester cyclase